MCYNLSCSAGVAHPVERHLAKVEVASSSLVTRSIKENSHRKVAVFLLSGRKERLERLNAIVWWTIAREGATERNNYFAKYKASEPRHPLHKRKQSPKGEAVR